MNLRKKFKFFGIVLLISVCILILFLRSAKSTRTDFAYAYDFAMALRTNDPIAYELSDPTQHSRIDNWMATHVVQDCTRENSEPFTGGGTIENGYEIYFDCQISEGWYVFTVHDLALEQLENGFQVVNWGEIEEGNP